MKTIKTTLILAAIVFSIKLFAEPRLAVYNPQTQWGWSFNNNGTIEEAEFVVHPKGAFAEISMYLTFSSKDQGFSDKDSLEVDFTFNLPEGAFITDSWLWIDHYISQAVILDVWTARSIYEGIVKRRKDPSILTKQNSNQYNLKIYPLKNTLKRKVKITYLAPFNINTKGSSISIPVENLKVSFNPLQSIKIYASEDAYFFNPLVNGTIQMNNYQNKTFNTSYNISMNYDKQPVTISYSTNNTNGIYSWNYTKSGEKYYQLAILPSLAFGIAKSKKTLFLIDIDTTTYSNLVWRVNNKLFTDEIVKLLDEYYTSSDSINLAYTSGGMVKFTNNGFKPATDENKKNLIDLTKIGSSKKDDLYQLVNHGIAHVKNYGNNANIIIVSNNGNYNSKSNSKAFINDLKKQYSSFPQIYIIDAYSLHEYYYYYYYYNGFNQSKINSYYYYIYYSNNNELYKVLSQMTGGSYLSISNVMEIGQVVQKVYLSNTKAISPFELNLSTTGGFSYSNYFNDNDETAFPDRVIVAAGKYTGELPMQLQVTGFYDKNPIMINKILDHKTVIEKDSTVKTVWAGLSIKSIEGSGYYYNTNMMQTAIETSIKNRVLSYYTAFLALEALTPVEPCDNCLPNEEIMVTAETIAADYGLSNKTTNIDLNETTDTLVITPNPFETYINIKIKLNDYSNAKLIVTDIYGRTYANLPVSAYDGSIASLIWNGEDLPKGFYIVTLVSAKKKIQIKIVKY